MSAVTPLDIPRLRALCAELDAADVDPDLLIEGEEQWCLVEKFNEVHDRFASAARSALPAALDRVEELEREVAGLRCDLGEIATYLRYRRNAQDPLRAEECRAVAERIVASALGGKP